MSLPDQSAPEDFERFWRETADEAKSEPLDFHRSSAPEFSTESHAVERIEFRGMHGAALHGWLAYPPGARRLPAFLWAPPYGRDSRLPDEYGTRPGFTSLSFNHFGLDSFHQEEYTPARGYFAEGADDPGTWVFRRMFQNALIALRVLQAQLEVDESRCASMGLSQGGGMSIWLGAWCPIVRCVCADLPFLGAMQATLSKPVHRYPLKELTDFAGSIPLGMPRVLHTVSYFDTLHHAAHCSVPTQVALGTMDPATRPHVAEAIFDALPGKKRLQRYEAGHDWFPAMIPSNLVWLLENLK